MDAAVVLAFVYVLPGLLIAITAANLCSGDKFTAFFLCFLFGPVGWVLLLAIEYSHSIPKNAWSQKPPKIRYCRKCKLQLSTNAKECPGCKFPVQPA